MGRCEPAPPHSASMPEGSVSHSIYTGVIMCYIRPGIYLKSFHMARLAVLELQLYCLAQAAANFEFLCRAAEACLRSDASREASTQKGPTLRERFQRHARSWALGLTS